MRKPLLISLAGLVLAAAIVTAGFLTVREDEIAVQEGIIFKASPKMLSKGRYWRLPLIFKVYKYSLRPHSYPFSKPKRVTQSTPAVFIYTKEGLKLGVLLKVQYRLNPKSILKVHREIGPDFPHKFVDLKIEEILKEEGARYSAKEIYFLTGRKTFEDKIKREIAETFKKQGFFVDAVEIDNIVADAKITQAILTHRSRLVNKIKILLIGLDGAEWDIIMPLVRKGKLPHIARLMREGCYGRLRTLEPILSPLILTSIATGKRPEKHGILDLLVKNEKTGEEIPITSNFRKVKALWNILSECEKRVGVVGWLVTWPAEKVNGFIVSDRFSYLAFDPSRDNESRIQEKKTYPEDLLSELKGFTKESGEVKWEEINRFIHISRGEFEEAVRTRSSYLNRITSFISTYVATETYRNVGLHLLKTQKSDLFVVYFEGIDGVSHLFMKFMRPRLAGVSEKAVVKYGRAVEEFYIYQDEIIGQYLENIDENTTVIIFSDHGFKTGLSRPTSESEIGRGPAADWHGINGILIMYGNYIQKGKELSGASILDITPTILALFGLPVAKDMDGKVLLDAIDPEYLTKNPIEYIDTYEVRSVPSKITEPIRSAEDELLKEKLRSLGYINPETANTHNNLGNIYKNRGEYDRAVAEFKKAIDLDPNVAAFYDNLGSAYSMKGEYDKAIEEHRKALQLDPKFARAYNNLGIAYFKKGLFNKAEETYRKALQIDPNFAKAYCNLGNLFYRLGSVDEAIKMLEKSLEIEPDLAESHYNLGVIFGEKGWHDRAIAEFKKVLQVDPRFSDIASVHDKLGVAYFYKKMYDLAIREFKKALAIDPYLPGVHSRLGVVHLARHDHRNAKLEFEEELNLNPDNQFVKNGLQKLKEMGY